MTDEIKIENATCPHCHQPIVVEMDGWQPDEVSQDKYRLRQCAVLLRSVLGRLAGGPASEHVMGDDWMQEQFKRLLRERDEARQESEGLRAALTQVRQSLAAIVIDEGDDAGLFLLSADSPTHYDAELRALVYDNDYFSPLGEALVMLARMVRRATT